MRKAHAPLPPHGCSGGRAYPSRMKARPKVHAAEAVPRQAQDPVRKLRTNKPYPAPARRPRATRNKPSWTASAVRSSCVSIRQDLSCASDQWSPFPYRVVL